MVAVALIGVDGAGKTTIADRLRADFPRALKTIYMGSSIQSSNYALPTSRLNLYLKRRRHKEREASAEFVEYPPRTRGKLGAALSLCNQLAEEWYRQLVSWWFQLRGFVVLYDRHFIFEHAVPKAELEQRKLPLSERLHLWLLNNAYPKPHLTLFLDAPVAVLQKRKEEQSVERLRRHRDAVLEVSLTLKNFIIVDARQSVDEVYADVERAVLASTK